MAVLNWAAGKGATPPDNEPRSMQFTLEHSHETPSE